MVFALSAVALPDPGPGQIKPGASALEARRDAQDPLARRACSVQVARWTCYIRVNMATAPEAHRATARLFTSLRSSLACPWVDAQASPTTHATVLRQGLQRNQRDLLVAAEAGAVG